MPQAAPTQGLTTTQRHNIHVTMGTHPARELAQTSDKADHHIRDIKVAYIATQRASPTKKKPLRPIDHRGEDMMSRMTLKTDQRLPISGTSRDTAPTNN